MEIGTVVRLSEAEVLQRFRELVETFPSQTAAADTWGLARSYISDILHGRRPFSDQVLALMGLSREVIDVSPSSKRRK